MRDIRIIIAESAISIAPDSWKSNKKINQYFNKYYRMPIIDSSVHQHLLQNIPLEKRKDRPDILHFGLLTVLGYAKFLPNLFLGFSTEKSYFEVNPETRIPRSQSRFYGILEQLLSGNSNNTYIQKQPFPEIENANSIVFSEDGSPLISEDYHKSNYIFGGFAHGKFSSPRFNNVKKVSLGNTSLELWTALSLFINKYHDFHEY